MHLAIVCGLIGLQMLVPSYHLPNSYLLNHDCWCKLIGFYQFIKAMNGWLLMHSKRFSCYVKPSSCPYMCAFLNYYQLIHMRRSILICSILIMSVDVVFLCERWCGIFMWRFKTYLKQITIRDHKTDFSFMVMFPLVLNAFVILISLFRYF